MEIGESSFATDFEAKASSKNWCCGIANLKDNLAIWIKDQQEKGLTMSTTKTTVSQKLPTD